MRALSTRSCDFVIYIVSPESGQITFWQKRCIDQQLLALQRASPNHYSLALMSGPDCSVVGTSTT
eukprot:m.110569 g.110569  ORF g.110569 m.110569 type:complete len:65 (-) comp15370_c0_seq1:1840-2034(-)